jgi:hypothetical protein
MINSRLFQKLRKRRCEHIQALSESQGRRTNLINHLTSQRNQIHVPNESFTNRSCIGLTPVSDQIITSYTYLSKFGQFTLGPFGLDKNLLVSPLYHALTTFEVVVLLLRSHFLTTKNEIMGICTYGVCIPSAIHPTTVFASMRIR